MLKFIKMPTNNDETVWVPRNHFHYALDRQNSDTLVQMGWNLFDHFFRTKLKTKQICSLFAGPDWAPVHMKMRKATPQKGMTRPNLAPGRICVNPFRILGIEAIDILYDGDQKETPSTILHLTTTHTGAVVALPPSEVIALLQKATTTASPEPQEQEGVNDETEIEDDEEENADS